MESSFQLRRRDFLRGGLAAAAAAVGSGLFGMKKVGAHTMLPGQWDRSGYAGAIATEKRGSSNFCESAPEKRRYLPLSSEQLVSGDGGLV